MIVCFCNKANCRDVKTTIERCGATSIEDIKSNMTICDKCKSCEPHLVSILERAKADENV